MSPADKIAVIDDLEKEIFGDLVKTILTGIALDADIRQAKKSFEDRCNGLTEVVQSMKSIVQTGV